LEPFNWIVIQLKGSNQMNGLPWLMLLLGN